MAPSSSGGWASKDGTFLLSFNPLQPYKDIPLLFFFSLSFLRTLVPDGRAQFGLPPPYLWEAAAKIPPSIVPPLKIKSYDLISLPKLRLSLSSGGGDGSLSLVGVGRHKGRLQKPENRWKKKPRSCHSSVLIYVQRKPFPLKIYSLYESPFPRLSSPNRPQPPFSRLEQNARWAKTTKRTQREKHKKA